MTKKRITSVFLSLLLFSSFCGCSKKNSHISSDIVSAPAENVTSEAASIDEETTASSESSAASSGEAADGTSAAPTTEASEPETEAPDISQGFPDSLTAAEAFYDAYINHDAEAVYAMFSKEEIQNFYKLMEPALDGKAPEEVFRKSAVIRAIDSSMDNISGIMESNSASSDDKWSVSLNSDDLKIVDTETLDEFNSALGLSYTSIAECRFVFYKNESNGESFSGNSSAFTEKDGKWYLSFSNAMGVDLMNYLELD